MDEVKPDEVERVDQPLATVMVSRPWHWGIVVVADPELSGQAPDVEPERTVSANDEGLIVLVRHAQDGVASFDPGFRWAEATVTIRQLSSASEVPDDHRVLFDGVLLTPSARLEIGDADDVVVVPAHEDRTRVQVRTERGDEVSAERVWIDLHPVDD